MRVIEKYTKVSDAQALAVDYEDFSKKVFEQGRGNIKRLLRRRFSATSDSRKRTGRDSLDSH